MYIERGSTRSHSLENYGEKRLWACRKADYVIWMIMTRNELQSSPTFKYREALDLTPWRTMERRGYGPVVRQTT